MDQKELFNEIKQEVVKKRFNETKFNELVEELDFENTFLNVLPGKKESLVKKAVSSGSKELISYLVDKKLIDENNSALLLNTAYKRSDDIFSLVVNELPDFMDMFFNSGLWKIQQIARNDDIPELNMSNGSAKMLVHEFEKYKISGKSFYIENYIKRITTMDMLRECLTSVVNDKNQHRMDILKNKKIPLNCLKCLRMDYTLMSNIIEKWVANCDIPSLSFMIDNGYTPSATDLIYIDGNQTNEKNKELVDLFLSYDSEILDKTFTTPFRNYKGFYDNNINLMAFLFEEKEQIKTSFLNYLAKNSNTEFFNENMTFLFNHRENKKMLNKKKLFKFLKLEINLSAKINGTYNVMEIMMNEGENYNLLGKEWLNFIDKAKQKGFPLNDKIVSKKENCENMFHYSQVLYSKILSSHDQVDSELPMLYCIQNGVDTNVRINTIDYMNNYSNEMSLYFSVSENVKKAMIESPLTNLEVILNDLVNYNIYRLSKNHSNYHEKILYDYKNDLDKIAKKLSPEKMVKVIEQNKRNLENSGQEKIIKATGIFVSEIEKKVLTDLMKNDVTMKVIKRI